MSWVHYEEVLLATLCVELIRLWFLCILFFCRISSKICINFMTTCIYKHFRKMFWRKLNSVKTQKLLTMISYHLSHDLFHCISEFCSLNACKFLQTYFFGTVLCCFNFNFFGGYCCYDYQLEIKSLGCKLFHALEAQLE